MIKLYWHNATVFDWYEILEIQYEKIKKSGLLTIADKIVLNTLGSAPGWGRTDSGGDDPLRNFPTCFQRDKKIEFRFKEDTQLLENDTLEQVRKEALISPDDCYIGYFHIKGVMSAHRMRTECGAYNWGRYMEYFILEHYDKCIEQLEHGVDICGVEWRPSPNHYSGGFWWATARYLKTLPELPPRDQTKDNRILAEFWVGQNKPKIACLFNYYDNLYVRVAKREEYGIYK